MRRGALLATLAIGAGLIAAPAIFQMFGRAPLGGQMIASFRPFMNDGTVSSFQAYMREIGRAEAESRNSLKPYAESRFGLEDDGYETKFPSVAAFSREWRNIDADMSGMLRTMDSSLGNFAAVDALPPFVLFPWFFVAPGLVLVALSWSALRARSHGSAARGRLWLLAATGLGLIAAPAVFQMFTRAPMGAQMIDDFRPLMTPGNVTKVQHYFLAIAGGEGELRGRLASALEEAGTSRDEIARRFPDITKLHSEWPKISGEMAPMFGAMSDNLDNYAAVDALPPFYLFPWFFVAPGVLVALAAVSVILEGRKSAAVVSQAIPRFEGGADEGS